MNKKPVIIAVTLVIAAVIIAVTVIFSPIGKDNKDDTSSKPTNASGDISSKPSFDGSTGSLLSGEELESMTDNWVDFTESLNSVGGPQLEVVPQGSKPSGSVSNSGTTTSVPTTTTSVPTTTTSNSTSTSKPSNGGYYPGIW